MKSGYIILVRALLIIFVINSCYKHENNPLLVEYHISKQGEKFMDTTMIEYFNENKNLYVTVIVRDYIKKIIIYDSLGNIKKNITKINDSVEVVNFKNIIKSNTLKKYYGLIDKDTITKGSFCDKSNSIELIIVEDKEGIITKEFKQYNNFDKIKEYKVFRSKNKKCYLSNGDSLILHEVYKYDHKQRLRKVIHIHKLDSLVEKHFYKDNMRKIIKITEYDSKSNKVNTEETTVVSDTINESSNLILKLLKKYNIKLNIIT